MTVTITIIVINVFNDLPSSKNFSILKKKKNPSNLSKLIEKYNVVGINQIFYFHEITLNLSIRIFSTFYSYTIKNVSLLEFGNNGNLNRTFTSY